MSETYSDLGGGTSTVAPPAHQHRYDRESGWCRCGRRDDGQIAEYSPAWRAARRASSEGTA